MNDNFRFIALKETKDFLDKMDKKTRKKVMYNIWKCKSIKDKDLFKPLTDDIWEFRTLYNKEYVRLFAFWDKEDNQDTLVVGTHGIYKKTSKIPQSDIEKANRIRQNYFKSKNG